MFATFMNNPLILNYLDGKMYKGNFKVLCVPGLNCYSCPAAIGSCPIGSLQAMIGSAKYNISFYVLGMMTMIATLFGRGVCGFFCPFGWFQELLHKMPSRKMSTLKLKYLPYIKYVVLIVFVIILPLVIVNEVGMGDPYFCKYICPVGILEGAIPLAIVNSSIRESLGWLFTWKILILSSIITLSIFFYRPFCKWLCPLGAFYGLFNKLSFFKFKIDTENCVSCDRCSQVCKMDVVPFKTPNHSECIRCGECIATCPKGALKKSSVFEIH